MTGAQAFRDVNASPLDVRQIRGRIAKRGRDADQDDVARGDGVGVRAERQLPGFERRAEVSLVDGRHGQLTVGELFDTGGVDVHARDGEADLNARHPEVQADVTPTDDGHRGVPRKDPAAQSCGFLHRVLRYRPAKRAKRRVACSNRS